MILDLTYLPVFNNKPVGELSVAHLLAQGIIPLPHANKTKMLDFAEKLQANEPFDVSLDDVKMLNEVVKSAQTITVLVGGIVERHLQAMIANPHKYESDAA